MSPCATCSATPSSSAITTRPSPLTSRAVVDHCLALTRERPLALFVEQAHWADRSSLKVLVHLARWVSVMPLLLVLVADRRRHARPRALFA